MGSAAVARETSRYARTTGGRPPTSGLSFAGGAVGFRRRWEMATRDRENRQGRRRSLHGRLTLIAGNSDNGGDRIGAECLNIGDGGLFAVLPDGARVGTGQQYTFQLDIAERGPEPGCSQRVCQRGEIIRIELLLDEKGCGNRIGIGVRLFGPRSGMVPMPVSV
jgi:hypothetical protein